MCISYRLISDLIYLKNEETNRRTYHLFQELRLSVFGFIEDYYNSKRSHGTFGMLAPNEVENLCCGQV
jgi:transposase InsO family protein